jgi:cytochrome c biogenesis protein CcmG, thiol:disulfide interchange protein DsbE
MTASAEPEVPRRSGLRTIVLALVVVVGLLAVVAVAVTRTKTPAPSVAGSGNGAVELRSNVPADEAFALPAMTLEGFADGPEVALADFRGKPLVINFWATWCAPCVREMPEFQKAEKAFGDKVALLGVDVEDAPPNAEPFVERLGITYPMAIDPQRELYFAVGAAGMPTTLLVDPDGIVRYRHTGDLDLPRLKSLVKEHLDVSL